MRDELSGRTCEHGEVALMPNWLLWTLVGLGTWCAVSVPVAFLLAGLFGRTRTKSLPTRGRVLILARPAKSTGRDRTRSGTLTKSG
jgi:hypothetical protein